MENKQALISAALLEAIWSSRKKDMIDLITPFILYAVAKETSPNSAINTKSVQKYVQEHFAYPDMPESIIKSALARKPLAAIEKKDKLFFLIKPIDDEIAQMNQRERECNASIELIGRKLSEYLTTHCKRSSSPSTEDAINKLHRFFARYGLEVGTETLASVTIEPKEYEVDYYIARFIFECKDNDEHLYTSIIDLVKGYFLRLAIYIQPNNGNIQSASFANTCFVLDTPVLIDLLGYKGKERENSALSLYRMLKRQNATLCYLPNIKQEMIDILTAYKYSLIPGCATDGTKTLEGLNAKGFDTSDVEREIQLLESKLESIFNIVLQNDPAYAIKPDGTVDEKQVLGEEEIKLFIKNNTDHYSDDNLESDVASVVAVHKLRNGHLSNNIESSRYVFVTNNSDFVHAFNQYYKENVEKETFQLSITVNSLSAITWIKCGEVENISETSLLKNAYCAMQPIPEILNKLEEVLNKMKESGKILPEQVVALRASRVFQNDLWKNSFGDIAEINEQSVASAQKKYEDDLIKKEQEKFERRIEDINQRHDNEMRDMKAELQRKDLAHRQEMQDESNRHSEYIRQRDDEDRISQKRQMERIRNRADQEAKKAREEWFNARFNRVRAVTIILIVFGIIGLIATFAMDASLWITVSIIIYFIISAISVFDTVLSRKSRVENWLIKESYQYETKIRELKIKEYCSIIQTAEISEELESENHLVGV